jgi:hypothetical protein
MFITKKRVQPRIPRINLLNQLLAGGAIMLVIDRIWNGELFLVSENLLLDLALGFAMTLAVSLFWAVAVIVTVIRKPANTL